MTAQRNDSVAGGFPLLFSDEVHRQMEQFHTETTEKNFIRLFYNIWFIILKYNTLSFTYLFRVPRGS